MKIIAAYISKNNTTKWDKNFKVILVLSKEV